MSPFFRLVITKRNVGMVREWIKLPIKLDLEVICDLQSCYLVICSFLYRLSVSSVFFA